jgi:tricorn protease
VSTVVTLAPSYLRNPHLVDDQVVFTAEDDVWLASMAGGQALRLTADAVAVSRPRLSPDASMLAWVSTRVGEPEVFVMPVAGGTPRQVTFFGAVTTTILGWSAEGDLLVASAGSEPFRSHTWAYALDVQGSEFPVARRLDYGPVISLASSGHGPVVIGTGYRRDPAHWKRYRGGTAGRLWLDVDGCGQFTELVSQLKGPKTAPNWIGDRIAFLADFEGHGNVYSVAADGGDLRRHTDHDEYYARQLSGDGSKLVYQHAGQLWVLDNLEVDSQPRKLDIQIRGSRLGRAPKPLPASEHVGSLCVDRTGRASVVEVRGNIVWLTHRNGPARIICAVDGIRNRLPVVLNPTVALNPSRSSATGSSGTATFAARSADPLSSATDSSATDSSTAGPADASSPDAPSVRPREELPKPAASVAYITDGEGADAIEIASADGSTRRLGAGKLGRILEFVASPDGSTLAAATHDGRLLAVTVADGAIRELEKNPNGEPSGLSFSPDSKWLAFSAAEPSQFRSVRLAEVSSGAVSAVTTERFIDSDPVFSADGKYLIFLSARTFDPVYDAHVFDLAFPLATRPYLVTLASDTPSPFDPEIDGQDDGGDAGSSEHSIPDPASIDADHGAAAKPEVPDVRIDLHRIAERVVAFPVAAGQLGHLLPVKGGVVWLDTPIAGELGESRGPDDDIRPSLQRWDFAKRKSAELAEHVEDVAVSGDGTKLVIQDAQELKVVPAQHKPSEDGDDVVDVDLSRIRLVVNPPAEWLQMVNETARLMKDHFWVEDMAGLDWDAAVAKYRPLVDHIASRDDLSDLLWEINGETGTSHAYEIPPALKQDPLRRPAFLGADISRDPDGTWVIQRVVPGDNSARGARSPLTAPGVGGRAGDVITRVNGQLVGPNGPAELLIGTAGKPVELRMSRDGRERAVVVTPLFNDIALRYLDWVSGRRAVVHEATDGRVGYVHVPDMMSAGWAAFHRDLPVEMARDALIVDTRDNSGGHTSQLVIEKLTRKIIGWDTSRHYPRTSYPDSAPRGPLVSIANEHAGSDGDIVNAAFKTLQLGPVIGTRTWGGVIGIDGRYTLVDGTAVTQPRYSFWFEEFGWDVENFGVDPDVVVEFPPQAWANREDPQLQAAIDYLVAELASRPERSTPNIADRPSRRAPGALPPRP